MEEVSMIADAPAFPAFISRVAAVLPVFPLQHAVSYLFAQTVQRHESLLDRLGEHSTKTVAIVPVDLPVAFLIRFDHKAPSVEVVRNLTGQTSDARISGTLLSLIDLVEGRLDGDAMFFSRDLSIEGDVEAVVAFRNAIDAEEIDLIREASASLGPLAGGVERAVRGALDQLRRLMRQPSKDLRI
jgi:O2-independent ubiquinone biosynthesis accessory factor UbiT